MTAPNGRPACCHNGMQAVRVGEFEVYPAGLQYLSRDELLASPKILVPLTKMTLERSDVIPHPLPDFGGVSPGWQQFLEREIIPELIAGRQLMPFCIGSHGRTGTFIASLIALLEDEQTTPDPVAATRERHCSHAVETRAQAEAIFALRDGRTPELYQQLI